MSERDEALTITITDQNTPPLQNSVHPETSTHKLSDEPHRPRRLSVLRQPLPTVANMAEVTLRTRKFIRNPLLGRKQMVVYVLPQALARNTQH